MYYRLTRKGTEWRKDQVNVELMSQFCEMVERRPTSRNQIVRSLELTVEDLTCRARCHEKNGQRELADLNNYDAQNITWMLGCLDDFIKDALSKGYIEKVDPRMYKQ